MSRFEEQAFPVGKAKSDLASLKNQLTRLKDDLDRFVANNPKGPVVAQLRERIKQLETQITEKTRQAKDAGETGSGEGSADIRSASARLPSRRR